MITEKPHRPYYQQTVDETLTNIQSSLDGLSSTEATARLEKYGENALPQKPAAISPHCSPEYGQSGR